MIAGVIKEINTEKQLLAEPTSIEVDAWDASLASDLDGLEAVDGTLAARRTLPDGETSSSPHVTR